MEADVWLDGRRSESVRHMTSGQAALNEIIILNLQAMNLPSCSLSSVCFIATYGKHVEARQLEKGDDVNEET